jgi:hypothetical protein
MDTYKEKKMFDEMYERGNTPWTVWETRSGSRQISERSMPSWTSERYVPTAHGFHRVVGDA